MPRTLPATYLLFFFNDTATTEIYTLSLHDALPISSIHIEDLSRDPVRFRRAKQRNGVANVGWCSEFAHGSPSVAVPVANHGLYRFRQSIQDAVFGPAGTDGVHGDLARSQGHREVTA